MNILLTTELLMAKKGEPYAPEKQTKYLEIVHRNAERLDRFVKKLLDVAKIQEGEIEFKKELINFSEVLNNEIEHYLPIADARDITIERQISPGLFVIGDREKLEQVVSNILSNAIKFTRRAAIIISLDVKENHLFCEVKDNGCGIAATDLPRIFDSSYTGKNENHGTGLGLTIAKAWIDHQGGKIWATSDGLNKGTTITFQLPIVSGT
jgi:signal transduction histidine kinase